MISALMFVSVSWLAALWRLQLFPFWSSLHLPLKKCLSEVLLAKASSYLVLPLGQELLHFLFLPELGWRRNSFLRYQLDSIG